MPKRSIRFPSGSLLCLLVFLLALGCDDETIGPQTQGDIEGIVRDAETNAPIAQANVTTSPPTQSVLTDEDGTFAIQGTSTGNYTVDVSKSGYQSRSVQVRVQENETTSAKILLERTDDFGAETDSLTAQVTNWYNDRINRDSTGADTIFVDVEYSARNTGDVGIQGYELYFKIDTMEGSFVKEVNGDSLDVGQQDLSGFRKRVTAEAQSVRIEDLYWSTSK